MTDIALRLKGYSYNGMVSFDDVAIHKLPIDNDEKLTGNETGDGDTGSWSDWDS